MAAFASDRRSGWVRVLVLILCALFIFAVIATPPAFAISETVALFTAASVLSAAVAALGFKLSSDAEGQATLNQMVKDFAAVSWSLGLVAVGDKVNGLLNGVQYIKMQVLNGKTYLDQRIVAWCQQWLGTHGVYDAGNVVWPDYTSGTVISNSFMSSSSVFSVSPNPAIFSSIVDHFSLDLDGRSFATYFGQYDDGRLDVFISVIDSAYTHNSGYVLRYSDTDQVSPLPSYIFSLSSSTPSGASWRCTNYSYKSSATGSISFSSSTSYSRLYLIDTKFRYENGKLTYYRFSNFGTFESSSNDTGLSGTDTIGADYKDKTLDQILDGLKTWAQDWYDAGADSATNTVAGAKDLPLTVGEQAASANPALNPDVVYNPPFALPLPDVRSGATSAGTITAGQENAAAAETATADVAENQTVINSLVSWALNYIDPDTGLFSKFPLCVPYDAYLLVTSSLGVDAVSSDSIFGASPGDLDGVVTESIDSYSDFQPIINIDHDFELDGTTYPISISIDLTPWQPLVTFFREGMALLLVAELIGSEYKRIRGH